MREARRAKVERLREMTAAELSVEASELLVLHVDRVEPSCVADLYALEELRMPGFLGEQLATFVRRTSREIRDLPVASQTVFFGQLAEVPATDVPANLRALAATIPTAARHAATWADTAPSVVVLPTPLPVQQQKAASGGRIVTPELAAARRKEAPSREEREAKARKERVSRARVPQEAKPKLEDDPRYPWMRNEILTRLSSFANLERGLLETVLISSVRASAVRADVPWTSLSQEEVLAAVRALSRERKVVQKAGRWVLVR
jgi:hypothetical protein